MKMLQINSNISFITSSASNIKNKNLYTHGNLKKKKYIYIYTYNLFTYFIY